MTRMDRAWVGLLVTMAVMIAAVPGASAAPVCFALVSSGLLPLQGANTGEVACPAGATADGTFPVGAVPFGGFSVTTINGGARATAGTVSGITTVTTDVVGGPNTPDIGAISGVRSNIGSAAPFTYDYT